MADAFRSVEEAAPPDISTDDKNKEIQQKIKNGMVISSKTVKYRIKRKIGDTRLGCVYEVLNERNEVFAMKVEWKNPDLPDPKLGMEIAILRHMRQTSVSPHFIEYIDRCAKPHYYFMVTSIVGPNLEKILQLRNGKLFSVKNTIGVTLQAIDALRELHRLGYIHRDIRPHNLLAGSKEKSHNIYLLNFGSAAIYKKNKNIRKPRPVVPMKGHVTYASLSSHEQQEQSPKDDIESLIYTMYSLCDVLPWKDKTKSDEIKNDKKKCRTDEDVKNSFHKKLDPKIMHKLMEYLDHLTYFDQVDYEYVRGMLQEGAKSAGVTNYRDKFEWEEAQETIESKASHDDNDSEEESSAAQVVSRRVFNQ